MGSPEKKSRLIRFERIGSQCNIWVRNDEALERSTSLKGKIMRMRCSIVVREVGCGSINTHPLIEAVWGTTTRDNWIISYKFIRHDTLGTVLAPGLNWIMCSMSQNRPIRRLFIGYMRWIFVQHVFDLVHNCDAYFKIWHSAEQLQMYFSLAIVRIWSRAEEHSKCPLIVNMFANIYR